MGRAGSGEFEVMEGGLGEAWGELSGKIDSIAGDVGLDCQLLARDAGFAW